MALWAKGLLSWCCPGLGSSYVPLRWVKLDIVWLFLEMMWVWVSNPYMGKSWKFGMEKNTGVVYSVYSKFWETKHLWKWWNGRNDFFTRVNCEFRLANATWFETGFGQQNHWIYRCLNPHKLMEKGSLKYGPHNMQICAAIPKVFKQRLCALTILGMLFLPHVLLRIPSRPIIGGACMPTNCPEKTFVTGMWLDDMCMPKSCWREGSAD